VPRLTKRYVDALRCTDGDLVVWDDDLPGFGLRVRASGRRYYVAKYRAKGRQRWLTLGPHGVLTPEQARRQAAKALSAARDGADPAVERRAEGRALTVADLAERYLSQHAEPKKKAASLRNDRLNLRLHVVPSLGRVPLAAVTREDVATLHHALRETPTAANRVLALLSKMFNLAERWGLRQDGSNPCRHVERFPEHRRERFLSDDELARLGNVLKDVELRGVESTEVIAAIRLLLFTGCRLSEILRLGWEDVDVELRCLRFADSKTGAKRIPLNSAALEVLIGLPRKSPWVIPGRDPAEPLVNLAKPWKRIRELAGLDDVRIHDLRHTHGSSAAGAGLSLHLVGALLGHRQPGTTARYAHLAEDPVREASERVGLRLSAAMRGVKRSGARPRMVSGRRRGRGRPPLQLS
jgi:integrase